MGTGVNRSPLRFGWLDAAILAAAAAGVAWVAVTAAGRVDHAWQWSRIPRYLVRVAPDGGLALGVLSDGLWTTLRLSVWAGLLATVFGTAMGLARALSRGMGRAAGRLYVEGVRNMPPLVLVFLFYYFVSDWLLPARAVEDLVLAWSPAARAAVSALFAPPDRLSAFLSAVLTLALYEGAYITEIVRAGVQSIERGQWEAGQALGLTRVQQIRHVVAPQALARVVPPLAGQFISTVKDSAIVSVISIRELTFQGQELVAATFLSFEVWITVLALYFAVCMALSALARRVEISMGRWGG